MVDFERFEYVYKKHNGVMILIINELSISRATFFRLKNKLSPDVVPSKRIKMDHVVLKRDNEFLENTLEDCKITNTTLDNAEANINKWVLEGDKEATFYVLKNHAWRRGWRGLRKAPEEKEEGAKEQIILNFGNKIVHNDKN